jgi:acetyl-CoA/propionyl-CoA carboxylase biotin carboxyl carrier protein
MLEEPGFTADRVEDFTVHTTWIDNDCDWLDELAQPLPPGVVREKVRREWFEVDGKWIRLGFPAALVGSGGPVAASAAAPAESAAAPVPEGAVLAGMNGLLGRWLVESGSQVEAQANLGVLEAMKMENPILADRAGLFTTLVTEGTAVKEGQPIATIV